MIVMLESEHFKPLYYLLWLLLHSFVWLIQYLHRLYNNVVDSFDHSCDHLQCDLIDKIPRHIAVSVNEDCVYFDDLVNIILWCERFNVSYLSIYKSDGYILSHKHELEETYASKIKLKSDDCFVKNCFCDASINGYAKRFMSTNKLKLRLLVSDDSRQSLVNAAQHLCVQQKIIEQNDISDYLKINYDFPDAELLINFGSSPSLYCFPLWQIRLTEMYFFRTHRCFKFSQFFQVLRNYSKCQQRFGT